MKRLIVTGLVAVALSGSMLFTINASSSTPASAADPLVTKSYVDAKISAEGSSRDDIVTDVMAQIEFIYGDKLNGASTGSSTGASYDDIAVYTRYTPVSANKGQVILGGEGTEIILRSGKAVGYIPDINGLVDVTDGKEIMSDTPLSINHLVVVPRDDGRGVMITENAWFIIKGPYRFK